MPVLLLLAVLLLLPLPVAAHPETGFLSDAVAEVEYKMVVEINPKDLRTRNRLGIVLYRKNKLAEAAQQFAAVLKMAPGDFDAHDGMGLVKLKEKNYPEAVGWFQRAIAINGEDTLVHYNLGIAFEQIGRLAEAAAQYRQAREVNERLLRRGINRELEAGKRESIKAAITNLERKISGRGAPRK